MRRWRCDRCDDETELNYLVGSPSIWLWQSLPCGFNLPSTYPKMRIAWAECTNGWHIVEDIAKSSSDTMWFEFSRVNRDEKTILCEHFGLKRKRFGDTYLSTTIFHSGVKKKGNFFRSTNTKKKVVFLSQYSAYSAQQTDLILHRLHRSYFQRISTSSDRLMSK